MSQKSAEKQRRRQARKASKRRRNDARQRRVMTDRRERAQMNLIEFVQNKLPMAEAVVHMLKPRR
jgi:hypothetical protein